MLRYFFAVALGLLAFPHAANAADYVEDFASRRRTESVERRAQLVELRARLVNRLDATTTARVLFPRLLVAPTVTVDTMASAGRAADTDSVN